MSAQEVRRIAALARIEISSEQISDYQSRLAAVLSLMETLRSLDVATVEPMTSPIDLANILADDLPGPTLSTDVLMNMAPDTHPPFIKIPKVLGEGS